MSIDYHGSTSCDGSGKVGLLGAITGVSNIIGLGGVLSGINGMDDVGDEQKQLQKAQQNLKDVTTKWQNAIQNLKLQGLQDEVQFLQTMITAVNEQESVITETLNEKVSTNSLMIGTLIILVTFLIFFDIL
jgi:hypothetical protein